MNRTLLIISFVSILLALLCGYMFFHGFIRFNYPDRNKFPILGIDISHHQGAINWEELKTEDISFIIIKATEGADYKDPRFLENWTSSKVNGYRTGGYHFYRLCKTGSEQADNFIATVPYGEDNLPPVVDLEFGGNCKTDKTIEQIQNEVNDFLVRVEKHYHKKPIIYATNEFYKDYLSGSFHDYPIWMRDIYKEPELKDGRPWLIWQFANRGHVKGINTYVDLNVLNGKTMEGLN